jgi:opacity protein-like surface antigen
LRTETNEFGPLISFSDSSFGMALGGGLDVKLSEHVAIRAIQLDYLRTGFFNETQNKGRLSVGVVFRFGRK